ncbi:hypothetical protein THAOC_02056, partial [Thalassiosira oceanica]
MKSMERQRIARSGHAGFTNRRFSNGYLRPAESQVNYKYVQMDVEALNDGLSPNIHRSMAVASHDQNVDPGFNTFLIAASSDPEVCNGEAPREDPVEARHREIRQSDDTMASESPAKRRQADRRARGGHPVRRGPRESEGAGTLLQSGVRGRRRAGDEAP